MAPKWLAQILHCFPNGRDRSEVDFHHVTNEPRSVSGRQYVQRQPTPERFSFDSATTVLDLPPEGPPPKGQQEALSWLNDGDDEGVIAARIAASPEIRETLSVHVPPRDSPFATPTQSPIAMQTRFDRDENGLAIFDVGSPGIEELLTPPVPPALSFEVALERRANTFPKRPASLDITQSARSPAPTAEEIPVRGSRPEDWKHLDLPHKGAVWPFGVGYESFSERVRALDLLLPQPYEVLEEEEVVGWKVVGSVDCRPPKFDVDTRPVASVPSRAASIVCPSEYGSEEEDLPVSPTVSVDITQSFAEDSSKSLDVRVESPLGSMASDRNSRPGSPLELHTTPTVIFESGRLVDGDNVSSDECPDSPVDIENVDSDTNSRPDVSYKPPPILTGLPEVEKLANDENISSDECPDSPVSIDIATEYMLTNGIVNLVDIGLDSATTLVGAPGFDKLVDDDYCTSKIEGGDWGVVSERESFEVVSEDGSLECVLVLSA